MRVVLASQSGVKAFACREVFGDVAGLELVCVKALSNVNEQPLGDETLRGAFNRIANARVIRPDGDVYVAIENGLFEENGQYVDRAVVVLEIAGGLRHSVTGDGVLFPRDCVEDARARGFDRTTAGQVMQERGLVQKHDDPHLDLAGRSRSVFLVDTLRAARRKAGI